MKLLIKRIIFDENCTLGCVQVYFSGRYKSQVIKTSQLRTAPWGQQWALLGETLEPHAIVWVDKPLIGQWAGKFAGCRTAIPEGHYRLRLSHSRTYKRRMPTLHKVPMFGRVLLRSPRSDKRPSADIVVPKVTLKRIEALIKEAMGHGEKVHVVVHGPWGWTLGDENTYL